MERPAALARFACALGASRPAPRAIPHSFRRLARAGFALAGALLALAAGEIAVRAAGLRVPARADDSAAGGLLLRVPDHECPGLGFTLRPGWSGTATYPGSGDAPARTVRYRVNEQGFRGPAVEAPKPAGCVRIVALGDSFTFGTGADEHETWPHLLEQELAARRGGRVEVLNWGVPATNTRQQVALLRRRAAAFEPDLVVLCAYVNDASGLGIEAPARPGKPWEVRLVERLGLTSGRWPEGAPATPAQRRASALRERSWLADLALYHLHGYLVSRVTVRNYESDWAEGSPGLASVAEAVAGAADLSRRAGFDLVATMYPDLTGLGGRSALAGPHAELARICERSGVPFHDLTGAFAGRDPRSLVAHAHDRHPNVAANRLAAADLAGFLLPRIPSE